MLLAQLPFHSHLPLTVYFLFYFIFSPIWCSRSKNDFYYNWVFHLAAIVVVTNNSQLTPQQQQQHQKNTPKESKYSFFVTDNHEKLTRILSNFTAIHCSIYEFDLYEKNEREKRKKLREAHCLHYLHHHTDHFAQLATQLSTMAFYLIFENYMLNNIHQHFYAVQLNFLQIKKSIFSKIAMIHQDYCIDYRS